MRVTGGLMCGRRVSVPAGSTVRPTQDRVRESLFASLGGALQGARFLDLFAGSGVVGLEALSRGAAAVTWVESNRRVLSVLRSNVEALGGNVRDIVAADVLQFLRRGVSSEPYSLVFVDPPYGTLAGRGGQHGAPSGDSRRLFDSLSDGGWLSPEGLLVVEVDLREDLEIPEGWSLVVEKRYGRTKILIARQDAGK